MAETSTAELEQLMSEYVDLWNGDVSKLDVLSESVVVYDSSAPGGEIHGRDEFEAHVRAVWEGFPDFHISIDDMLTGDDVIMAEWTIIGTHEGEFNGIPPTNREIEITGMAKILVDGGQVREDRIYSDSQELIEQLGLAEQ